MPICDRILCWVLIPAFVSSTSGFIVPCNKHLAPDSFTISPKTASANLNDVEDKLRKIFGTKVSCKQRKNGSGEIVIEYYSSTELERLFELFEIIDKNYN